MGDINIHLDAVNDPHTVRFQSMLDSYDLTQNVATPTHEPTYLMSSHQAMSSHPVSINVEPPTLSDHSFIVASLSLQFNHGQPTTVVRRRQWRKFDFDSLCDDLRSSKLLTDPSSDADGLFECYDTTMKTLVDLHASFADVKDSFASQCVVV
jgi:hypothetical protein